MGLFKKMHDIMGVNASKLSGSLRETSNKMKETKEKIRNSEKCRKMRLKTHRIN